MPAPVSGEAQRIKRLPGIVGIRLRAGGLTIFARNIRQATNLMATGDDFSAETIFHTLIRSECRSHGAICHGIAGRQKGRPLKSPH